MSYRREQGESVQGFRERIANIWAQYIGPVPEFRTRGRRVPLSVITAEAWAMSFDVLAELGLIPPRFPPKKPKAIKRPVKVPHIVSKTDYGNVEFYVRYDTKGRDIPIGEPGYGNLTRKYPQGKDYDKVIAQIKPDLPYNVYVKNVYKVGGDEPDRQLVREGAIDEHGQFIKDAGSVKVPHELKPNQGLTWGTRKHYAWMLREPALNIRNLDGVRIGPPATHYQYATDYAWKYMQLDAKGSPDYARHLYGSSWTRGRLEWLIEDRVTNHDGAYYIGSFVSIIPLSHLNTQWLAMRNGEMNCVAKSIMGALDASHTLTAARRKVIEEWEGDVSSIIATKPDTTADDMLTEYPTGRTVRKTGASYTDTDKLATKLRMHIQFYDLADTLLHEKAGKNGPAYANGQKTIKLYRSDGHCSAGSPTFEPPTSVVITSGPELKWVCDTEIKIQTKLREAQNHTALDNYIVATLREYNLVRAQIIGHEIVADGVLYRPRCLDKEIHIAAASLGLRPPIDEEEGLYRWAEKKLTTSQIELRPRDAEPILYPELDIHIGGVQSLHLKHWLKSHQIKSLWPTSREGWRHATVEAIAWTAEGVARESAVALYDMRAAFLACDSRPEYAAGPSHEAALRFGFPRGGRSRRCIAGTWESVAKLTGFIRYRSFTLAANTPTAIAAHIAHHFRDRHNPIAIPAAVWLHEHGYVEDYSILEVEYTDRIAGLTFPNDRNLSVRLIGSCSYHSAMRTFYTSDPAERDHFMSLYGAAPQPVADGFLISYPAGKDATSKMKDHSHIRTYVLAYQAIAMWTAIESLGDNLIGTSADSVLVRDAAAAMAVIPMQSGDAIKWGEFRPKPMPNLHASGPIGAPVVTTWASDAETKVTMLAPMVDSLCRNMTAYIEPAGFGKTTRAIKEANESGRRVLILVGINEAQIKIRNDLIEAGAEMERFTIDTYHHFFHLPDKHEEWTPGRMGKAGITTDIVIWDEFAMAGQFVLGLLLPWMKNVGLTTILCGDPLGQLQEFGNQRSGEMVINLLNHLKVPIEYGAGIDWRARDCPILQTAKAAAWCKSDSAQLSELCKIATQVAVSEMVDMWQPGDIVIEATNRIGEQLEDMIWESQLTKHGPKGRCDVLFKIRGEEREQLRETYCKKTDGVLGRVRAPIYPGFHFVTAAIGTVVTTTMENAMQRDMDLWKLASRITVHSVQGKTIKRENKIFICLDSMPAAWCRNAIYVAMSRAELASQLYVFGLTKPVPTQKLAIPAPVVVITPVPTRTFIPSTYENRPDWLNEPCAFSRKSCKGGITCKHCGGTPRWEWYIAAQEPAESDMSMYD